MKKRLLITSTLMAAVLACALGTGTYAWYQATAGGLGKVAATPANVSTSSAGMNLGSDTVYIVFGAVENPTELSDEEGKTYYVDGAYKYLKYEETVEDEEIVKVPAQFGHVSVSAAWTGSDVEAHKGMAGQTAEVTIDSTGTVRLLKDNTSVKTANVVDSITCTITVNADGSLSTDVTDVYFAVGPTETGVEAESSPVTGTITAA